ncbi:hypothetical protein [Clostridium perfringens]|uniref:hypothetical protein n=1 Tax=Clostridium perfringens TaxID=1502 RepID=UPI0024BC9147|nr:hypothetical protein [Clostridium perfringens]
MLNEEKLKITQKVIRELKLGVCKNEHSVRDLYNINLKAIYPDEVDEAKIDQFYKGSEKIVKMISDKNKNKIGFQDVDLGKNTLEWKLELNDKNIKDGKVELRKYISGKFNLNGYAENYLGILSDGLNWIVYEATAKEKKEVYTEKDIKLKKKDYLQVKTENDAEYLYNFIYKYLFEENSLILGADVLKQIFGESSHIYAEVVNKIESIVAEVSQNDPLVVRYIQMWDKYKQYNRDVKDELNRKIYAQDIYMVLLTRILVAILLEINNVSVDDTWIKSVLNGSAFNINFKIINFIETDIYYWIIDDKYINKFINIARKLYFEITKYDFVGKSKDNLLHLMYEELIPGSHKKEYGQKSTDFELCDNIVDRLDAKIKLDSKCFEPTIGTGSIYRSINVNLINKMNKNGMNISDQLDVIQNNLIGVDIDPIAITLAKAEWIITNVDLIKKSKKTIYIPIYHADTLLDNPLIDTNKDKLFISLETNNNGKVVVTNVILLKKFISTITLFNEYLIKCDRLAEISIKDEVSTIGDEDIKFITNYIGDADEIEIELFKEGTKKICSYFLQQRKSINNEIWRSMLFNNNIPQLLFNNFDLIIGNLPWLALSSLPDISYKEELKKLSVDYNIRARASSNHHQEVATVFAIRCMDKFLKENGVAAFVMPGTIIMGDHHTLFRKEKFKEKVDVTLKELWNIPRKINPFKVKACVLFMIKRKSSDKFIMRELKHLSSWRDAPEHNVKLLTINNKNAWTIKDGNKLDVIDTYYAERFRQGADLFPRTAIFIENINDINDYKENDIVQVTTADYAAKNVNGKKLKGIVFQGYVEKKYIYTTTISEMLLPYYVCKEKPMIVLPIKIEYDKKDKIEKIKIVSNREMIQNGELSSAEWFEKFDQYDEFKEKKFRHYLNVRNKLTDQEYFNSKLIVHLGAGGTYPCASVEIIDNRELKFIADQTTYVAEFYDENEAYYVVGILNSQYMCDAIEAFQSEGAFEKRHIHKIPFIFVPKYDVDNPKHIKIAELSKELSQKILTNIIEKDASMKSDLKARRRRIKEKYSIERKMLEEIIRTL